jgi:hypothetical protein
LNFVPGGIANREGDIFGTSPFRIIPTGRLVIDVERAGAAIMCGWRAVDKVGECDPAFAWLERTAAERLAYSATRGLTA